MLLPFWHGVSESRNAYVLTIDEAKYERYVISDQRTICFNYFHEIEIDI